MYDWKMERDSAVSDGLIHRGAGLSRWIVVIAIRKYIQWTFLNIDFLNIFKYTIQLTKKSFIQTKLHWYWPMDEKSVEILFSHSNNENRQEFTLNEKEQPSLSKSNISWLLSGTDPRQAVNIDNINHEYADFIDPTKKVLRETRMRSVVTAAAIAATPMDSSQPNTFSRTQSLWFCGCGVWPLVTYTDTDDVDGEGREWASATWEKTSFVNFSSSEISTNTLVTLSLLLSFLFCFLTVSMPWLMLSINISISVLVQICFLLRTKSEDPRGKPWRRCMPVDSNGVTDTGDWI